MKDEKRQKAERSAVYVVNPSDFAKAIAPFLAQIISEEFDNDQKGLHNNGNTNS